MWRPPPSTRSSTLLQDGDGATDISNCATGNLVGLDPKLGPLQDNGGPTPTIALLPGSPAIGAGSDPLNLTSDQRGYSPRVVGTAADIGAYEVGATAPSSGGGGGTGGGSHGGTGGGGSHGGTGGGGQGDTGGGNHADTGCRRECNAGSAPVRRRRARLAAMHLRLSVAPADLPPRAVGPGLVPGSVGGHRRCRGSGSPQRVGHDKFATKIFTASDGKPMPGGRAR